MYLAEHSRNCMNKYKDKTLYRLIPKATVLLLFLVKSMEFFFISLCFNIKNNNSVIVFYIIIYSKLVLNLSEFLSYTEHTCYFEEGGKPNSYWSSVTCILLLFFLIQVWGNPSE